MHCSLFCRPFDGCLITNSAPHLNWTYRNNWLMVGWAAVAAGAEDAEARKQRELKNAHLISAQNALLHVIEAHPRLAALMASRPALAPLLNCLHPVCRWPAAASLRTAPCSHPVS